MVNLKTYTISVDITSGSCNAERLDFEIKDSGYITNYDGLSIEGDSLIIMGDSFNNESGIDAIVLAHDPTRDHVTHKILLDYSGSKSFENINYKIDLKSGVSYTPVFTIHMSGPYAGLLEKTEYYKNYNDQSSPALPAELILVVEEVYTIDNSDLTLNYSARPALSRIKTWKWVKEDGTLDEINVKTKPKIYDTRRKRHIESERRRRNIIEQLIDHVGLAGVLSGAFIDSDDAYDKLTEMQEIHSSSFSGWISSGRGSIIDVVTNDTYTSWLDIVIPDNGTTQAMVPWMIGLDFRTYIQEKLKGNIV